MKTTFVFLFIFTGPVLGITTYSVKESHGINYFSHDENLIEFKGANFVLGVGRKDYSRAIEERIIGSFRSQFKQGKFLVLLETPRVWHQLGEDGGYYRLSSSKSLVRSLISLKNEILIGLKA